MAGSLLGERKVAVRDSWASALHADIGVYRATANAIDALDEERSDTVDEEESVPSTPSSAYWWVDDLIAAGQAVGLIIPSDLPSVRVLSACTGCCAEGECFKALNVPYEILSASDVNAAYREFIIGNHGPDVVKHLFPSIEAQLEGRDCVICRSSGCSPADGKSVDLLLAGSPCDPYSIQRAKRFKPGAVLDHGLCGVTMDKVVNMFRVFEPKVGVLEQVRGFEMPLEQGSAESPCERFLQLFGKQPFTHGGYWMARFHMCASAWLKISRPRVYFVFFRKDKFEKDAVKKFKDEVQALLQMLSEFAEPRCLTDLLLPRGSTKYKEQLQKLLESQPAVKKESAAKMLKVPEWRLQAHSLREGWQAHDLRPWSRGRHAPKCTGLSTTPRIAELLDLAVISQLGVPAARSMQRAASKIHPDLKEVFCDVSQNPARKPWTNSDGITKCLTTSTTLFSFFRDGLVTPLELMIFQGHRAGIHVPNSMSPNALKELAGQGICLPCLGCILLTLSASGAFHQVA